MPQNRRFILVRRPVGLPMEGDFRLIEEATPALQEGEFLLRNHFASLDPAIRGWLDDVPSYLPPIQLGEAVRSSTVGVVCESRNLDFPVGQWATGRNALEDYSHCKPGGVIRPIDPDATASVTHHLSVLGVVGLTAYFALLDVGSPNPGDTVLITGAAGAVGSLVGQIAKMKGCRTIGVAGGAIKCERLIRDYGYDAAIDYHGKSVPQLSHDIREAAPHGVDVHFENVGGGILDAGLSVLNPRARVVLCGMISQYNNAEQPVRNLLQLVFKGARMEGFILTQHTARFGEALPVLKAWVNGGKLRMDEHIEEGLERALPAFLRLFDGGNTGKMILKIANH